MVGHPIPVPFGKRRGRFPPDALPVPFQKSEPDKTEDKPPAPPEPKQKKSRHWLLLPLVKSHTNGAVEDELKHLTITLFQKHLNDRAIDIVNMLYFSYGVGSPCRTICTVCGSPPCMKNKSH